MSCIWFTDHLSCHEATPNAPNDAKRWCAFVLADSALQGLCLLGIYEGYKAYYFDDFLAKEDKAVKAGTKDESARVSVFESPLDFRSPMVRSMQQPPLQ